MELENIVANTVYIKAKRSGADGDKGRSRRWRTILAFPHISQCLYLEKCLGIFATILVKIPTDLSYDFIVEQQPIGKRLFRLFCRKNIFISDIVDFVDSINTFAVCIPGDRRKIGLEIYHKFLSEKSGKNFHQFGNIDKNSILHALEEQNDDYPDKALFCPILKILEDFLRGSPFSEFLNSVYFCRYLQWKWLEKTPVTKHTFRMYRVLGKGGFGEVCACQVRATGKLYACKKMEKKRMKKRRAENLAMMEKETLQRVNSRFVVNLAYTFETKDALCLVLTIMNGGDLKFHIHNMNNGSGFNENRARFYAAEITLGLQHMHAQNIVYRDLKPENILIDDQGHVRISDLGLAVYIESGGTAKGRVGTAGYMAPEVVMNARYTFSPDWFGLGCIVYEMIMGHAPFRRRKERVRREEVDRRVCEDMEEYNSKFSDNSKRFCQSLLQKDPHCRLGCDEIGPDGVKHHSWFSCINWVRLEAGLEEAPFLPDPHAVYAKDVLDIEQFSTIKGVTLDNKDAEFYKRFCSGAVSIPWQNEMLETGCFDDLNEFYKSDGTLVDNLNPDTPPIPQKPHNRSFFGRLLKRENRPHGPPSDLSTIHSNPIDTEKLTTTDISSGLERNELPSGDANLLTKQLMSKQDKTVKSDCLTHVSTNTLGTQNDTKTDDIHTSKALTSRTNSHCSMDSSALSHRNKNSKSQQPFAGTCFLSLCCSCRK
ncbi:G protein-coupled receptor kinase 5 [Schistosoma japonicum]|nr:G protein-coupled receptor kinase 5 [Schistosoma japonicum]